MVYHTRDVANGWKSSTGVLPFTGDGSERARHGIDIHTRSPSDRCVADMILSMSSHRMILFVDLIGPIDLTDLVSKLADILPIYIHLGLDENNGCGRDTRDMTHGMWM